MAVNVKKCAVTGILWGTGPQEQQLQGALKQNDEDAPA